MGAVIGKACWRRENNRAPARFARDRRSRDPQWLLGIPGYATHAKHLMRCRDWRLDVSEWKSGAARFRSSRNSRSGRARDSRLQARCESTAPVKAQGHLSVETGSLRKLLADLGVGGPRPRDASALAAMKASFQWAHERRIRRREAHRNAAGSNEVHGRDDPFRRSRSVVEFQACGRPHRSGSLCGARRDRQRALRAACCRAEGAASAGRASPSRKRSCRQRK